jgi:hypothetical protein
MWKNHQPVCHNLLDVVPISKITNFEAEFQFREKREGFKTTGIPLHRTSWTNPATYCGMVALHQQEGNSKTTAQRGGNESPIR